MTHITCKNVVRCLIAFVLAIIIIAGLFFLIFFWQNMHLIAIKQPVQLAKPIESSNSIGFPDVFSRQRNISILAVDADTSSKTPMATRRSPIISADHQDGTFSAQTKVPIAIKQEPQINIAGFVDASSNPQAEMMRRTEDNPVMSNILAQIPKTDMANIIAQIPEMGTIQTIAETSKTETYDNIAGQISDTDVSNILAQIPQTAIPKTEEAISPRSAYIQPILDQTAPISPVAIQNNPIKLKVNPRSHQDTTVRRCPNLGKVCRFLRASHNAKNHCDAHPDCDSTHFCCSAPCVKKNFCYPRTALW